MPWRVPAPTWPFGAYRSQMPRIVDLSIAIDQNTPLPPPVKRREGIEVVNFPPSGALQGSWITFYSHTGSHVDAPLHVIKGARGIGDDAIVTPIAAAENVAGTGRGENGILCFGEIRMLPSAHRQFGAGLAGAVRIVAC